MGRLKRKDKIAGTTVEAVLFGTDAMELCRVKLPGEQRLRFLLLADPESFGRPAERLKLLAFAFPGVSPDVERITSEPVHGRGCLCLLYAGLSADTLEGCFFNRSFPLTERRVAALLRNLLGNLRQIHGAGCVLNGFWPGDVLVDYSGGRADTRIWNVFHAVREGCEPFSEPYDCRPLLALSGAALNNVTDRRSDLFSAAAAAWRLLHGEYPWETEFNETGGDAGRIDALREKAPAPPRCPAGAADVSPAFRDCLLTALRGGFDSADAFLAALETAAAASAAPASPGNAPDAPGNAADGRPASPPPASRQPASPQSPASPPPAPGKGGFADVAGMAALKERLRRDVIDVLKDPAKARRYRVTIPNGMLLYGPPGCGKTFFAEKFAEETGFRFRIVKASDLGSIYVHGTQQKIAGLFDEAARNAPFILCFDEFDALAPSRDSFEGGHRGSEVNELLSQMNNCSERGIFVVATTNRKGLLDPAVLRTGRIDFRFYVPPPDLAAREAILTLLAAGRPGCGEVDCAEVAALTEGFVTSDLRCLIDEAARSAMAENGRLSTARIRALLATMKPSVDRAALDAYARMAQNDGAASRRRKTGP